MKILGMISGTSHDGIDAAIVDFDLRETAGADALHGTILHTSSVAYNGELRRRLVAALPPMPTTLAEVCELDTLIGQAFADAAADAITDAGAVDLIVSHGQTVFHWVEDSVAKGTLQIGQPAWIAEGTGTPVLADVRIRDIAVGGHGAPLVSYLDALLLAGAARSAGGPVAALNLGGISNMTVVRSIDDLYAYDIGPSNALIDAVVVEHSLNPLGYDDGGAIAAAGRVDEQLLAVLMDDPYYRLTPPKSTGKELFHGAYIAQALRSAGTTPSPSDLVTTLTELTVRTVANDVRRAGVRMLAVSGGGVHNAVVLDGLRHALPDVSVVLTDSLGVPSDAKEAIAFALIGWCTWHGLPGARPRGTGAREARILGAITPGDGPLVLPPPRLLPPASLALSSKV